MNHANAIATPRSPLAGRAPSFLEGAFAAAGERVSLWVRRSRSRRALPGLSEHMLRDIGISRADALKEAAKWFWQG